MMKIYTKTGDGGETALIGGERIKKSDLRLEAYGTVDELNSFIGLLRVEIASAAIQSFLLKQQENLYVVGAFLSCPKEKKLREKYTIGDEAITALEQQIDEMLKDIPPMTAFTIPGAGRSDALSHVARTICRRAERATVATGIDHPTEKKTVQYLNRLSDYLFALSRRLVYDVNLTETVWEGIK